MDAFSIPDIGATGAIIIIVIIFTLLGLVKGMVRMFFGLVSLVAASIAAYWGFQRGDAVAGYMIANPEPWMAGAVGIFMGLAVFFAARAIFSMVVKPTKVIDGKKQNRAGMGGLLGIVGGLAFAFFLFSGVRYLGTITELDWLKKCLAEEGKINQIPEPPLVTLMNTIDATVPGRLHQEYDFLNNADCAQIAQLKILTGNNHAIAVSAGDHDILKAFSEPDIRKLLESSPELGAYIQENKFSHLLANKKVGELSSIPAAQEALAPLNIPKALGLQPEPKKKKKKKADPKTKK